MPRVEKTVFICYRRTNAPWALAVFQHLTHHGFDVFFDFVGIGSGDFEQVIIENIRSRAHFLVLLTPSALERCHEPGDWFRREIQEAMACRRNIVPILLESFDFGAPGISSQLTGPLAQLKKYNGPKVYVEYFQAAMARLMNQFLVLPLEGAPHSPSESAKSAALVQQTAAASAPCVQADELTAQEWFERGFGATDTEEKLRCYGEAIRLKPDFAEAYNNRGIARGLNGDTEGEFRDLDEAIRLQPDFVTAYCNRGLARQWTDTDGAFRDLDEAIRLQPDLAEAFKNRGIVRRSSGDLAGAMEDYHEAIRLRPDYATYYNRALTRVAQRDREGALRDYTESIRLKPDHADAYHNRGNARYVTGDLDGALTDYDEAIRLRPDLAEFYYNRGRTRQEKGDLGGAKEDFAVMRRLGEA